MKLVNFLYILVLLSLFTASCSKDKEPVYIYDIEEEFKIGLRQSLGDSDGITIQISTLSNFPDNYEIEATAHEIDGRIEVNIFRILKPNTPSDHQAVLTSFVKIDSIGPGLHGLDLIIRNTIFNEGLLSVLNDKIILSFEKPMGISTSYVEVNRFSQDAFWGVILVDSSYHAPLLDVFLDSLDNHAIPVLSPLEGNYGHFTIKDGNVSGLTNTPYNLHRTFYMTCSNFSTIDALIQKFKAYELGFEAQVTTAQGQDFFHIDNPSSFISNTTSYK